MSRMSRRTALGSVAASALTGLGTASASVATGPDRSPSHGRLTQDEFQRLHTPVPTECLLKHLQGQPLAMCHEDMRKEHGVWIPELVPVFEKLDALQARRAGA